MNIAGCRPSLHVRVNPLRAYGYQLIMFVFINVIYNFLDILHITSKEPVCPRVELIFNIIIILLIIFLGFIKSKPC